MVNPLPEPRRILVLNVNRMGDQLQALPFYWALKKRYPEAWLEVFVDRVGEKDQVARWLTPPVDEFIPLDLGRLRPVEGRNPPILEGSRYFRDLAAEIRGRGADLMINLSHGKFSALLMHFLRSPHTRVVGHVMAGGRHRMFRGDWFTYLFTMVAARRLNRFHIVDLYVRGCGLRAPDPLPPLPLAAADREWAEAFLTARGVGLGESIVAIQPGASEYRKRWEADAFARTLRLLHERHGVRGLVLGSPGERDLWDRMAGLLPPGTLDGVGTTLDQAKALLARAKLLITNDTGPMHVAAGVGTPFLAISLGSVYFPETFGYGVGHGILQSDLPCSPCTENLQCNDTVCHGLVQPEHAAEAAAHLLGLGPAPCQTDGAFYLRTARDRDGFLTARPVVPVRPSAEGCVALALREMWKVAFDFKEVEAAWADLKDEILLWYGSEALTDLSLQPALDGLHDLATLCQSALECARRLEVAVFQGERGRSEADMEAERLIEMDQTLLNRGYRTPSLQPLLRQYRFERERLAGGTPLDWAQLSQIHVGSLERRGQILADMLSRLETKLRLPARSIPRVSREGDVEDTVACARV